MSAENWTAAATVAIAVLTLALVIGGGIQALLTRQAINLGRKEFIATHRPRITVRAVGHIPVNEDETAIWAHMSNRGESTAFITEYAIEAMIFDTGGTVVWTTEITNISADSVECGRSAVLVGKLDRPITEFDIGFTGESLIIQGRIRYRDALGLHRTTSFCRKYRAVEGDFVVSDLPIGDGEYED